MTVSVKKDFFIRAQKKAYESGREGRACNDTLGDIIFLYLERKETLTLGVQKCLKDEWERGYADYKRTLLPT